MLYMYVDVTVSVYINKNKARKGTLKCTDYVWRERGQEESRERNPSGQKCLDILWRRLDLS